MSEIKTNYRLKTHEVEAYFWTGEPYANTPDWLRAKFGFQELVERPISRYALRDEEGNFYKWMDADKFRFLYERIVP